MKFLSACSPLNRTDRHLAVWIALVLATLLPVVIMQLSSLHTLPDEAQLRLLAGHPFYIGAEEAQVSLLSPVGSFVLCLLATLWLAAVLVRERRLARRTQVAFLAALALVLPGLICVLWGGVLYVAAPLACVVLLWFYAVPVAALWRVLKTLRTHTPDRS